VRRQGLTAPKPPPILSARKADATGLSYV